MMRQKTNSRITSLVQISTALILALTTLMAEAAGGRELVKLDTRPGVTVGLVVIPREGATTTVVLLPGGAGGLGYRDGRANSNNFLIRSQDHFLAAGFNIVMVGKPTDKDDMDLDFRISEAHLVDMRKITEFVRKTFSGPVWLVGTSRGTTSAAAAAIDQAKSSGLKNGIDGIDGIVLTSSVTSYKFAGAVPRQNLAAIDVPVLVMHHEKDRCASCAPHEASLILSGLTKSPIKKLLMVNGGANPTGDVCEALHWHGYIGMESEAVAMIAKWIKQPASN
jgi:hypothetical protein